MTARQLEGNVILLTGGRGFLGGYFADALQAAGATVVVSDVTADADVQLDVTDQASVDTAIEQTVQRHGRLDAVVNNAGIDPKVDVAGDHLAATFEQYPEEAMRQSIDVNLLGAWRVCKRAVTQFKAQGPSTGSTSSPQAGSGVSGVIVNVASVYGVTPPRQELYPDGAEKPVDYAMTKAGLIMLTRHLASQFGRDNIRANTLAPGGVVRDHDEAFQEAYAAHTSLGRMSTPDEVADALVFLLSDASRGMTGEVLSVDAGWSSR